MNLRHAAALALVGWYLMYAPVSEHSPPDLIGKEIDAHAPLNKWQVLSVFDSASQCQAMVDAARNTANDPPPPESHATEVGRVALTPDQYRERLLTTQCVSTDDPRLAK
jgi:hypothetical protein